MFTIVAPLDTNRLEQFKNTKQVYDEMPQTKEFIIPTRNYKKVKEYLTENNLMKDIRLVPYEHKIGFNPSKALNIGVREARYDKIIITSPEVKPITDVLEQFSKSPDDNIICQVADEKIDGSMDILVDEGYRDRDPAMYFLAMFQKSDIEKINGWDENFMDGYAYEDNDFGARWARAKLPFTMRSDIRAVHQYHPRSETIGGGAFINQKHFEYNNNNGITYCTNGLKKQE